MNPQVLRFGGAMAAMLVLLQFVFISFNVRTSYSLVSGDTLLCLCFLPAAYLIRNNFGINKGLTNGIGAMAIFSLGTFAVYDYSILGELLLVICGLGIALTLVSLCYIFLELVGKRLWQQITAAAVFIGVWQLGAWLSLLLSEQGYFFFNNGSGIWSFLICMGMMGIAVYGTQNMVPPVLKENAYWKARKGENGRPPKLNWVFVAGSVPLLLVAVLPLVSDDYSVFNDSDEHLVMKWLPWILPLALGIWLTGLFTSNSDKAKSLRWLGLLIIFSALGEARWAGTYLGEVINSELLNIVAFVLSVGVVVGLEFIPATRTNSPREAYIKLIIAGLVFVGMLLPGVMGNFGGLIPMVIISIAGVIIFAAGAPLVRSLGPPESGIFSVAALLLAHFLPFSPQINASYLGLAPDKSWIAAAIAVLGMTGLFVIHLGQKAKGKEV